MYCTDENVLKSFNKFLLTVQGGIGRNITATAVVRALAQAHPAKDIDVIAGCPEFFLKNPHVKRVHNLTKPTYILEDCFLDKRTMLLNVEPYQHPAYIYREEHFTSCWCDMLGVPCAGIEPEMFYTIAEMEMAKDYLSRFNRRMVLFQHQGGKIPETTAKKDKLIAKAGMYKRSLPENIAQEVTDELIKAGYAVGSVQHANQFLPKGAEHIRFPLRAIVALIPFVEAIITIDSFLLHGSACFKDKTPTLALWGGTDPRVLGYPWHKNLCRAVCATPHCHRPNSYFWDFEETGFLWDCPHNDICMNFSTEDIMSAFFAMMKEANKDERTEPAASSEAQTKDNTCSKTCDACADKGNSVAEVPANPGTN